jgi:hypothetical protein
MLPGAQELKATGIVAPEDHTFVYWFSVTRRRAPKRASQKHLQAEQNKKGMIKDVIFKNPKQLICADLLTTTNSGGG